MKCWMMYWLVQMEDKLYIIDQHAAHEKVLYERIVKEMKERNVSSQIVSPPIIISLNLEEQEKMKKYQNIFKTLGFEIESFGGREYSIRAVPQNLFGMTEQGFFIEVLDHLEEDPSSKTLTVNIICLRRILWETAREAGFWSIWTERSWV